MGMVYRPFGDIIVPGSTNGGCEGRALIMEGLEGGSAALYG